MSKQMNKKTTDNVFQACKVKKLTKDESTMSWVFHSLTEPKAIGSVARL